METKNDSGSDDRAAAGALDGASAAALLASGVGAFAVGLFVILNEAGLYAAPSLYGPAGGVSGRTTFAAATWLITWAILHARWKGRRMEPGPVLTTTLGLVGLGLVATFPPLWGIF
jgi:hypothetical protein